MALEKDWLALSTFWIYFCFMWYVYVLESKIDSHNYVGITNDLKNRLMMHNSGKVYSTKSRLPFHIVYCEVYRNKNDAAAREQFLKSGWGKNYLKRVLKHYHQSKKLGG